MQTLHEYILERLRIYEQALVDCEGEIEKRVREMRDSVEFVPNEGLELLLRRRAILLMVVSEYRDLAQHGE